MTAVTQYYRLGDLTEIYVLTGLEAKSPDQGFSRFGFILRPFSLPCR